MKNTITAEMSVRPLKEILIGENALLQYRQNENDENKVDICLRYVDHNSIREQFLVTLPKDKLYTGLFEINRDGTAIAMYQERGEDFVLDRVYFIDTHSFGVSDFLDLEYKKAFPYNELSPQFVKKRGTMDGEH